MKATEGKFDAYEKAESEVFKSQIHTKANIGEQWFKWGIGAFMRTATSR